MASGTAVHRRWADMPFEPINPTISRRYITGDRVTVAQFELKKNGVVPRHSHENEQVTMVLSGALRFQFPDREVVVRAGEVIQMPAWLEHGVVVLEDAVVCDVFSPIRQDWIDKTDTYFQR
jgi:unsaturated pyranuronate lyase